MPKRGKASDAAVVIGRLFILPGEILIRQQCGKGSQQRS